jgi:hypothetical protein
LLISEKQVANTESKLRLIEEQIRKAKLRPQTPERNQSIQALVDTARQMREELIRYQSSKKLKNVG